MNDTGREDQLQQLAATFTIGGGYAPPPDLDLRIIMHVLNGETKLSFVLHSPNGTDFHYYRIEGKTIKGSPQQYQAALMEKIEALGAGTDIDGRPLEPDQAGDKLHGIGHLLFDDLFSREMRNAYRRFRKSVRRIQITSDEPWIPWELIKPYDDTDLEGILDDDFLCAQFELTRWLAGYDGPTGKIHVAQLVCLEAGNAPGQEALKYAGAERKYLAALAADGRIVDASPKWASKSAFEALMDRGGVGLWHFAAHGKVDLVNPNESMIFLADGSKLRADDIHGHRQTNIRRDRPMVFVNACRIAQQGWVMTRLGGWVATWVDRCRCGMFIGPLWAVDDRLAWEFARRLYELLREGMSLGAAATAARNHVRELSPDDPTWLAYTIYGHPNARVTFGPSNDGQ